MNNNNNLHTTTNGLYTIVVSSAGNVYKVTNNNTGVVEYEDNALPQVIAVAEQFDYMLHNDMWKPAIKDLFGIGEKPGASIATLRPKH